MKKFAGFPDRMQFTPLPNLFFSSLLAQIDDLAELKVTLHLFRALYEQRGFPRLVRLSQLAADRALLSMLQPPVGEPPTSGCSPPWIGPAPAAPSSERRSRRHPKTGAIS